MSNEIIYQVIGGLLILFFLYLTYQFTKSWRWLHVTTMFFVFTASIFLVVYAAMSVRTHMAWKKVVAIRTAQLEQLTADQGRLIDGDLDVVSHTEPSIRELTAQLVREVLDRGRVWRNCLPTGRAGTSFTLNTIGPPPAVDPDAAEVVPEVETPPAAPAAPPRIDPQTVLYAFLELPTPEEYGLDGAKLPIFFVGEFIATAFDANQSLVTIKPTRPLSALASRRVSQAGLTWTLYETMPADGHRFFAVDPYSRPDWNKSADEEPIFGEMDVDRIQRVFRPHGEVISAEDLELYLRDGKRAEEDDPPKNKWVKLRFLQEYEIDVDSDVSLDIVTGGESFYDNGQAIAPLVQRGGPATFQRNDIGVFFQDQSFVQSLIDDGICELVETVFVRDLTNYESALRDYSQQIYRTNKEIRQAQRDGQAMTETRDRIQQQIVARDDELEKLNEDHDKVNAELAAIEQYHEELKQLWGAKRAELSHLYQQNLNTLNQLKDVNNELERQIDEASAQVLTGAP